MSDLIRNGDRAVGCLEIDSGKEGNYARRQMKLIGGLPKGTFIALGILCTMF